MKANHTVVALALLLLSTGPGETMTVDEEPRSGLLLVGNKGEDSLSFVDLATGAELGRAATGRMPHEIAVSPDGRQAAVVAYGGRSIDIFDLASRRKVRTIDLSPNEGPHGIDWLDDGRILATTERSRSLTIVDTSRGDSVSAVETGEEGTHMVAVSPDARHVFTANIQSGTVSVIDLVAGRLIRNFTVSGQPEAIALTPDGVTLWVGDLEGHRLQAFATDMLTAADESGYAPVAQIDLTLENGDSEEVGAALADPLAGALEAEGGTIAERTAQHGRGRIVASFAAGTPLAQAQAHIEQAIRAASPSFPRGRTGLELRLASSAPLAVVATGEVPIRAAASPDGRWIVTSNFGSGSLTLIDAATREKVRDIEVSGEREAGQVTILFSPDGRRIYAAETGRDTVAEVDLDTGRVLRRLPAGNQGDGLAIAPAGALSSSGE